MITITIKVMIAMMLAITITKMITIAVAMNKVEMVAMTNDDRDRNGADQIRNDDQPQAGSRFEGGATPADGC